MGGTINPENVILDYDGLDSMKKRLIKLTINHTCNQRWNSDLVCMTQMGSPQRIASHAIIQLQHIDIPNKGCTEGKRKEFCDALKDIMEESLLTDPTVSLHIMPPDSVVFVRNESIDTYTLGYASLMDHLMYGDD